VKKRTVRVVRIWRKFRISHPVSEGVFSNTLKAYMYQNWAAYIFIRPEDLNQLEVKVNKEKPSVSLSYTISYPRAVVIIRRHADLTLFAMFCS
jgi:hypothetical protein